MPDSHYRLRCAKVHLTYRTHLDQDRFLEFIRTKGATKMLSFVHEEGDDEEEHPTPYLHTHVFLWFQKRLDTVDARYFDFEDIHPHIQNKRGMDWAKTIVLRYHLGHKRKEDGRRYYQAPEHLYQEGVEEWKMEEDEYAIAQAAPSLIDACLELGIRPKSISDVMTVRKEGNKRSFEEIESGLTKDMFKKIEWDRTKALVLRGPSGCGKTNWAISQFERPYLVCQADDLKQMPEGVDGLVFDEMKWDFVRKKQELIYLTDLAFARTIKCRNVDARIPKGVQRIFTCNVGEHTFGDLDERFPPDCAQAIKRRFVTLDVDVGDLRVARGPF